MSTNVDTKINYPTKRKPHTHIYIYTKQQFKKATNIEHQFEKPKSLYMYIYKKLSIKTNKKPKIPHKHKKQNETH